MPRKLTQKEAEMSFRDNGCELLDKYTANHKYMRYIAQCGHENKVSLDVFKRGIGLLCKKCSMAKTAKERTTPYEDVKAQFEKQGAKLLTVESEYKGVKSGVQYLCSCGRLANTQVYHWFNGHSHCNKCQKPTKEQSYNWKPDKPQYMRIAKRQYTEYLQWRKQVFERDDFLCQCCGIHTATLQAHHIINYAENGELQHEVSNGVTLCKDCHKGFHKTYGRSNNNKEQLERFINSHKARNDYQGAS